nr:hypothetical protein [Tanacetum cinerariifolium]
VPVTPWATDDERIKRVKCYVQYSEKQKREKGVDSVAGPSYSAKQDLLMGSRELNAETLHQVFVPQWNVLNDSLLDDYGVSREFVDHLAPPALFSQIREMNYHRLFTKFNVGTARQAFLNAEVKMRTEYCLSERKRLESECEKQAGLLKDRDDERNVALENENDSLDGKVTKLQYLVSAKDLELKDLNVLGYELDVDFLEMALYLEEKFYPRLLTTISGRRWLLTRGVKLVVVKCLNSQEYLTALWSTISHAIEKEMQDGLSAGIDHGKAGRNMADVVAYNSAAKTDYNSALQRLRDVDFPLLAELNTHKDASTAYIMDLLRLESPLADAPKMSDLQPDVEQLTLPIHRPEDQVGDVAAQGSALVDVWVPLVDPLSAQSLIGVESTSGNVSATVVSTTALYINFASASWVPPITTYDYEIVNVDGQEDT